MLFKPFFVVSLILAVKEVLADVKHKGVNIPGFDFGCEINGTCTRAGTVPPLLSPGKWVLPKINKANYYADGIGQMEHFTKVDNLNIYRLPVSWQFLVDWKLGGPLDPNAFGLYNDLMQGCLKTQSHCILDIHNYARWRADETNDGPTVGGTAGVVGQGGPSNAQFGSLWKQLAEKYKNEERVMFGLSNEPWGLDMNKWSDTIQYLVTTIRTTGATTQTILLPGLNYTKAVGFDKYSAPLLSKVHNPDGSTTNLVYEVHQYMANQSGEFTGECITDHIEDAFKPLATYLRAQKRTAILAETGGHPTAASCQKYLCAATSFINQNSDVFLGYVGWAAGAFNSNYKYTLTPSGPLNNAAVGVDQPLLTKCIK